MNPFDIKRYEESLAYRREVLKAYKKLFSGVIKESFLVEMINEIETDPRYAGMFYTGETLNKLLSVDSAILGTGFLSLNPCKMIVMNHYVNTASLSDNERGKLQSDKSYKNQLLNDVINMCRVEKISAPTINNSSLEPFLPIIYYLNAVCNLCGIMYDNLLDKNVKVRAPFNNDFNYRFIYILFTKIKSCIKLAEIRATDELMVIFRTLIETFMTYSALWDEEDCAIQSFYEHDQWTFDLNYGNPIPEDLAKTAKSLGVSKVKFINYGWIKELRNYKTAADKTYAISIEGLSKLLDKKYESHMPNFGTELYRFYKACNPQTHGTTILMNFFQLELYIFQNIKVMAKFICSKMSDYLFGVSFSFNGVDLIDELDKAREASDRLYDCISSNGNLLKKTNEDYKKRALCEVKMRS